MLNNEVLEALETRRSIRAYKPTQITEDELQAVLRAGTFAPTAHGQQSPFIVAVQNAAMCDQLRRMNAEVMGVTTDPYYGAPTIVLVFVPEDNRNGVQDGSMVCAVSVRWLSAMPRVRLPRPNRARRTTHASSVDGGLAVTAWASPSVARCRCGGGGCLSYWAVRPSRFLAWCRTYSS